MKQYIKQAIMHPLVSGSAIIFIGSNIGNVCNFLFNVYLGHTLTPINFGNFTSLVVLIGLLGMPAGAMQPTVVQFGSRFYANKEVKKVVGLFYQVNKLAVAMGILIILFMLVGANWLSNFFQIHNPLLIIVSSVIIFIGFVNVVTSGMLQAKLAFGFISFITFFSTIIKLVLGVAFVSLGFSINGAVAALVLSALLPYLISFLQLKEIFTEKSQSIPGNVRELITYGGPTAVSLFFLTSFISSDVLLVKHFFSPSQAGLYAGLTLVGKVIFYFSAPINTVMFPLIVQRHTKAEKYHTVFFLAVGMVLLPSLFIVACYTFFPHLAILFFLKKTEYLAIAPLLGLYSIFITLFSVLSIFVNFFLSIKRTEIWIPVMIAAVAQVVLLWIYHSSFVQVISISSLLTALLLGYLLLYLMLYGKAKKH